MRLTESIVSEQENIDSNGTKTTKPNKEAQSHRSKVSKKMTDSENTKGRNEMRLIESVTPSPRQVRTMLVSKQMNIALHFQCLVQVFQ